MSNSAARIERFEKLQIAASIDAQSVAPSVYQQLGYRQAVAQQLLHEVDESKLKALNKLYDYHNYLICQILGI